jgi:uncharacterized protein (DUF885 family)
MIRIHTSLQKTPQELHQLGLDEVKRIRAALSELGGKTLGTTDVAEIQRKLRTDPAMHFATADEVEAKARATLARARAAIPQYFGILPKADCQVKVMGMHEAPYSTIAYYRNPAQDGSRPGYYMINTYQPETRPKYEAEALAFHESIPGHHLQIAIAMELTGIPEFRKHEGVTAYVEGWGLYTERLADDMHLYSSDVDRIGMLSFDAWRACRLVVDTGLHAMGWSRQQAIDYMEQNTVLAENNIANEVDRYIGSPGQALAYKCGQLEILRLRQEAMDRLGSRFDIKAFHDVVLRNGAVALPVLREQVKAGSRRRRRRRSCTFGTRLSAAGSESDRCGRHLACGLPFEAAREVGEVHQPENDAREHAAQHAKHQTRGRLDARSRDQREQQVERQREHEQPARMAPERQQRGPGRKGDERSHEQ